jgi:hypothetical protein
VTEVDVVFLLAVRQPRVRPLGFGEPVHEGVGGLERGAGLLALVVEGVGAGGDGGRQSCRSGGPGARFRAGRGAYRRAASSPASPPQASGNPRSSTGSPGTPRARTWSSKPLPLPVRLLRHPCTGRELDLQNSESAGPRP